ncbi:MAG: flagellar FliJ family protein [Hyphomicrobiales bacterium]|nr:flagellar FliJ family protein [Hyphomicrobiales bacterium]
MSSLKKTLRTLCRLRDWSVKDQQRSLAEAHRHGESLRKQVDALEHEIVAEQTCARLDPLVGGYTYAGFLKRAAEQRDKLDASIRTADEAESEHRSRLKAAIQERRKVEILAEAHEQKEALAAEAEEQKIIDEISTQTYAARGPRNVS